MHPVSRGQPLRYALIWFERLAAVVTMGHQIPRHRLIEFMFPGHVTTTQCIDDQCEDDEPEGQDMQLVEAQEDPAEVLEAPVPCPVIFPGSDVAGLEQQHPGREAETGYPSLRDIVFIHRIPKLPLLRCVVRMAGREPVRTGLFTGRQNLISPHSVLQCGSLQR